MLVVPCFRKERLFNKVVLMAFIAEYINILVLKLYCCFKDDKVVYLVIEYINRIYISKLKEEK
jgi:hypothetical protein